MDNPLELDYMQTVRTWLRWIDQWPGAKCYPLRHNRLIFVSWLVLVGGQIMYIRNGLSSGVGRFLDFGHSYIATLMHFINIYRVTLINRKPYQDMHTHFLNEIHLIHHKEKSEYAMKIYTDVNWYCKYFSILTRLELMAVATVFTISPIIVNIWTGNLAAAIHGNLPANGTLLPSVFYAFPFDYRRNIYGYTFIVALNAVLAVDCAVSIMMIDFYLALIVCHMWGHLKILKHNLETQFFLPADNKYMYSEEESKEVSVLLKENIKHHCLILECGDKIQKAFGLMLAMYLLFHQVCGCILLYQCSSLNAKVLAEYGLMTLAVFQQLFQVSLVFEALNSKSDIIPEAVYAIPWECMRGAERKMALLFLYGTQNAITVKALGVVPVGVRTMAGILKTAWSYFLMLKSTE